jgi:calcium-dependent protein kinase
MFFSYTMSPQVLQGVYSSQADLWSVGVMAYMMLSTSKPFYSKHRRRLIDMIMRGDVDYDKPGFKKVSATAIDFCKQLLVVDPKKRLTAVQALQHDWLVNREQMPDEEPDTDVLEAIDDCLIHYKHTSQLKKLALNVIAHRSTAAEIRELTKVFDTFDKGHDGVLSFVEFKEALEKMGIMDEEAKSIFASVVRSSLIFSFHVPPNGCF